MQPQLDAREEIEGWRRPVHRQLVRGGARSFVGAFRIDHEDAHVARHGDAQYDEEPNEEPLETDLGLKSGLSDTKAVFVYFCLTLVTSLRVVSSLRGESSGEPRGDKRRAEKLPWH